MSIQKLVVVVGLGISVGALGGCASDESEPSGRVALVEEGHAVPAGEHTRVLTVSAGQLARLADAPEVVESGPHFLAVDEDMVGTLVEGKVPAAGAAKMTTDQGADGAAGPALGPSVASLCIRTPFGPGWVDWSFHPNSTQWRSKPEDEDRWVGANANGQDTDAVHHNGWGCNVIKIPDDCDATVNSDGSYSCCCNAALSAANPGKYTCHVRKYSEIFQHKPPGCP